MQAHSLHHDLGVSGKFLPLTLDYLADHPALRVFHHGLPSVDTLREAMERRRSFATDRPRLVQALQAQYQRVENATAQTAQIESLLRENTFTVTTAHQCNVFLGPLYILFKSLHVIRLAEELNMQFPDRHFVPVFYMGSEDADLDELNHIHLLGQKLIWNTNQTGAVGRMMVDEEFLALIERQANLLSAYPHGAAWLGHIRKAYVKGASLADATFHLLHALLGDRGLIVLQPDEASLKAAMTDVFWRELSTGGAAEHVRTANEQLASLGYVPQAYARPINLFYLKPGSRERIEQVGNEWVLADGTQRWDEPSLRAELSTHPERFSPNVILRGVYQETILPNLIYVGGGGELAYWLQLKSVFDSYHTPFPLLQLRASFQFMDRRSAERVNELGLKPEDLFQSADKLLEQKIDPAVREFLELGKQINALSSAYDSIQQQAQAIDPTLGPHVESLRIRSIDKIKTLEKKMLRAERRKMADQRTQIETLQRTLFPGNGLQERHENIGYYLSMYGSEYLDLIYAHLDPFGKSFCWLIEENDQSN